VVFVRDNTDCCDLNSLVKPDQTEAITGAITDNCSARAHDA